MIYEYIQSTNITAMHWSQSVKELNKYKLSMELEIENMDENIPGNVSDFNSK